MSEVVGVLSLAVLVAAPVLLGCLSLLRARRAAPGDEPGPARSGSWTPTLFSALLYTLAFNLTFFVQELFLVVPKGFTPGLHPVLFHNDHTWQGTHPLARLFQGTGIAATSLSAAVSALLLARRPRSMARGLFLLWMVFCGAFLALPQLVIGALSSRSDAGMAMEFFHLGQPARTAAALLALAVVPPLGLWLGRRLLGFADAATLESAWGRARFVATLGTLPALLALPLIVCFRVPREPIEVVGVPVVVTWIGVSWMQAGAWSQRGVAPNGASSLPTLRFPLTATLLLLLVFQLVLRPGIRFG